MDLIEDVSASLPRVVEAILKYKNGFSEFKVMGAGPDTECGFGEYPLDMDDLSVLPSPPYKVSFKRYMMEFVEGEEQRKLEAFVDVGTLEQAGDGTKIKWKHDSRQVGEYGVTAIVAEAYETLDRILKEIV